MIKAEPTKTITRTASRLDLIPHFSERKLLLFLGDSAVVALAGLAALWLHSIVR